MRWTSAASLPFIAPGLPRQARAAPTHAHRLVEAGSQPLARFAERFVGAWCSHQVKTAIPAARAWVPAHEQG